MKFLIIAFALSGAIAAFLPVDINEVAEHDGQLESIIGNLINASINSLLSKLDEPLTLDDINVEENSESLSGTISVTGITISGIKSLIATYIDVNIGTGALNITLYIPDLNLQFKADVDVVLAQLIPLYGSGKDSIDITEIELTITGKANLSDLKHIKVENLKVLINLATATFNLNGLLNNTEFTALVNTVLNDNAATFINNNNALLSDILGKIFEDIINGNTGLY